jgi:hypothetical protein
MNQYPERITKNQKKSVEKVCKDVMTNFTIAYWHLAVTSYIGIRLEKLNLTSESEGRKDQTQIYPITKIKNKIRPPMKSPFTTVKN